MSETDEDTDDVPGADAMARAISVLAGEFVGVFGFETVERCVRDSYRQLADGATVATYLPLLAQRFARERLIATARVGSVTQVSAPAVLFVCAHNSGRSQMAAGWLRDLAGDIMVRSAGTEPFADVSPAVVAAMREVGIDLADAYPKPLTDEVVAASDVVVTMGCGEVCPVVPGRRYEDWILAYPVGSTIEEVRSARDEIRERVESMLAALRSAVS
jgi:protein-tyrosine-phosphatase